MIVPPDPRFPLGKFRPELVARIRREIQAGTYDTPEKLECALEKMLDQLDAYPYEDKN